MKPGFCYLAERIEAGQAVRRITDAFARDRVSLANPYSGRITELDDEGNQVDATEEELIQAARARARLTFQLWFSSDTDIGCSFRKVTSDIVCHAYSVDGLNADERAQLVRWAIQYFRQAVTEQTALLLVADPAGRTADIDWDAVAAERVGFPRVVPDVLGLPSSWDKRLPVLHGYSQEQVGDFELLSAGQVKSGR
jgi:hypothetical protein